MGDARRRACEHRLADGGLLFGRERHVLRRCRPIGCALLATAWLLTGRTLFRAAGLVVWSRLPLLARRLLRRRLLAAALLVWNGAVLRTAVAARRGRGRSRAFARLLLGSAGRAGGRAGRAGRVCRWSIGAGGCGPAACTRRAALILGQRQCRGYRCQRERCYGNQQSLSHWFL